MPERPPIQILNHHHPRPRGRELLDDADQAVAILAKWRRDLRQHALASEHRRRFRNRPRVGGSLAVVDAAVAATGIARASVEVAQAISSARPFT